MNRAITLVLSLVLVGATAAAATAQENPGGPPPPEPPRRLRGEVREPGMPGGPGGPEFEAELVPRFREETMRFDLMRGYIDLVDRIARLSRDPTTAGVAAVISAADILKARGADAGIEYFTKMLETAKSDAVKRAIRIQLIELYKQSGQQDKAMEQLTELINAAPAGPAPGEAQPTPPPPGR
jgi:hypothetical protein